MNYFSNKGEYLFGYTIQCKEAITKTDSEFRALRQVLASPQPLCSKNIEVNIDRTILSLL